MKNFVFLPLIDEVHCCMKLSLIPPQNLWKPELTLFCQYCMQFNCDFTEISVSLHQSKSVYR